MNKLFVVVLFLSCLCIANAVAENNKPTKPTTDATTIASGVASGVASAVASVSEINKIVAQVMSKDVVGYIKESHEWFKTNCLKKDKPDGKCQEWFGYNCVRHAFANKADAKIIPCQQFLVDTKATAKEIIDAVTKFKADEYKTANDLEEKGEESIAKLRTTSGFTGEWKNGAGTGTDAIATTKPKNDNKRTTALLQLRNKITHASPFLKGASTLWPEGKINYYFDSSIGAKDPIRTKVSNAIAEYNKNFDKCLTFKLVLATDNVRRVKIQNSAQGCYVTKIGAPADKSETIMNLAAGCSDGNTKHEFMHVLGFDHTQKRPDRDSFVRVNDGNIKDDKKSQFTKLGTDKWDNKGDYQYNSIMHYPSTAFAKTPNLITIDGPLPELQGSPVGIINSIAQAFAIINANARAQMGQRAELKPVDIAAIKSVYSCK